MFARTLESKGLRKGARERVAIIVNSTVRKELGQYVRSLPRIETRMHACFITVAGGH